MIESIIAEELEGAMQLSEISPYEEIPDDSHSLQALVTRNKRKNIASMETDEFEKFLQGLISKRRGGKAHLQRSDMEKLDMLTRWMKWIPGGTSYRKNLAKYLRSPNPNKRVDSFSDFRKYSYGDE